MAIEPIVLSEFGDVLRLDPGSRVADDDLVGTGIMWHNRDCYPLYLFKTGTHYRIVCKSGCGTIVVVPQEIQTYRQLREWCAGQIEAKRRWKCDLATIITRNARF